LGDLEPVDIRQAQVEDHEPDVAPRRLDGAAALRQAVDGVSLPLEDADEPVGDRIVVFDQEDPGPAHGRHGIPPGRRSRRF